jgi:hypothetical protein
METLIKYVNDLSVESKKYLIYYTKDGYKKLNKKIRNNRPLNDDDIQMLKSIDLSFTYAPEFEESITVYRGVRGEYKPSLISYISTTIDIDTALSFSGTQCCLLKITIPSGSKILPIYDISDFKQEFEILIDRTGEYIITSIEEPYDMPKIYNIVYIPPASIKIEDTVELTPAFDIDFHVNRIITSVSEEEIELFGVEEAVTMLTENMENLPSEAIIIATQILKKKYE